ncbi:hypothetical protein BASA62_010347 [Batrachochytrium salamandrivorans]|nr:hypothetical protein BASA62_010347 [Batrachochytrium salamandrivorans]
MPTKASLSDSVSVDMQSHMTPDPCAVEDQVTAASTDASTVLTDESVVADQALALQVLLSETLVRSITSTHVDVRISVLTQVLQLLQQPWAATQVSDQSILLLFQQLTLSLPRYRDSHSVNSVLDIITAAYSISHGASKQPVECSLLLIASKVLSKELSPSLSPATLFIYSKWTTRILSLAFANIPKTKESAISDEQVSEAAAPFSLSLSFVALLNMQINILDWLFASVSSRGEHDRKHLASGALNAFTRAVIASGRLTPQIILSIILTPSAIDGKESSRLSIPIGICITASRKLHSQDTILRFKDKILMFYSKSILTSKTVVSLGPFIADYVDEVSYQTYVISAADRLLLRSPEVALKVLDHFTRYVSFDVGVVFREKFADSLLNQFKSSNEVIRHDAAAFYRTLSQKSSKDTDLLGVVDIIVKAMSAKSPLPDHRVLFFSMLAHLPSTSAALSGKIISVIPSLVAKESNDLVMVAALSAFGNHVSAYLSHNKCDAQVIAGASFFLISGIKDLKSGVRKAHLSAIAVLVQHPQNFSSFGQGVIGLIDALIGLTEKAQAAGIALLDLKKDTPTFAEACISVQFIIAALQSNEALGLSIFDHLASKKFFGTILALSSPKAFLFSERLYGKLLVSCEEQLAFLEIVISIVRDKQLYESVVADKADEEVLANAVVWGLVNSAAPVRCHGTSLLAAAVVSDKEILERAAVLVRLGLGHLFAGTKSGPSPTTASIAGIKAIQLPEPNIWNDRPTQSSAALGQRALIMIYAILPVDPEPLLKFALKPILLDLAVITSLPILEYIHGADLWVRLCFRCGLDPRSVLELNLSARVNDWLHSSHIDQTIGGISPSFPPMIRKATIASIRLMAEVAADVILPIVLPYSISILSDSDLDAITRTDMLIHATPASQLFDDPVSKRQAIANDRQNASGRNTAEDKWERELKKEIEAKRGKTHDAVTGQSISSASSLLHNSKLSKADRELCAQQFTFEADIRARVETLLGRVTSVLDVLEATLDGIQHSLSDESYHAFGNWTRVVLDTIIRVILRELVAVGAVQQRHTISGRGVLAGNRIVALFFKLVQIVFSASEKNQDALMASSGDYEDVSCKELASCILRCFGVDDLSDYGIAAHVLAESFPVSVRRILDSLTVEYSSSNMLEASAFAIVFLLIEAVITRQGRVSQLKEKAHTELVMACSDVLLVHCAMPGASRVVPRQHMTTCLVQLIDEFPRLRTAARGGLLALTIAAAQEYEHESQEAVRESSLEGLAHLPVFESIASIFDTRVWLARSDISEGVQASATKLWEDVRGDDAAISDNLIPDLVGLTVHSSSDIRKSAGNALCAALSIYPDAVQTTLDSLYALYKEKVADPLPDYDDYGMVIPESLNKPDEWEARSGIAHALKTCVPVILSQTAIESLFAFLIDMEALGDRSSTVQRFMLDAGLTAVQKSGKDHVRALLDKFDAYLSKPAEANASHDRIREAVVILLGTVAQHLDADDQRIPEVVSKLIETLKTPSELVQVAVSECLPALIKVNKQDLPKIVARLLDQLFNAEKYGMRRGAAYGLSGIVKGCGIASLKDFSIMSNLKFAVEDKKNVNRREGALFAYETLSYTLGRLFEPYVIQILPYLLVCYGDSNKQIREATHDTSRVIMSKLSAHCVKLVLPSLLNGLADKAWRTKTGSIEMMASMSALAPKQLSQSLPMIVPSICDALADSHQRVQEAAKEALVQFGSVIKNPEIQELVPILISALVNPNHKTQPALSALLDTTFVHYIDAPSLALLVPIIHRGLKERSGETKKKGAQIMGNMSTLTDQRDLVPYLPTLIPTLKEVLVDPVPENRATAASAFGSMIGKLGEDSFPGLVSELLQELKSDTSPASRSGAAQGLSEVLSGLGLARLEALLPEIIASTSSNRIYVREGFMTLLVFLPATFGEAFTPYIAMMIPAVLRGLADESETVRESALHAGKVIVRKYAKPAINLLLPELKLGLFDTDWRIRQNSMQLLGDLLFRIAGISSKMETSDASADLEEGLGTEHGRQALILALGSERYEAVLASVYIIRGDASAIVRQTSLHVWKSIVSNTPRTLKEILPQIMQILISSLASPNLEKRGVAARTLGDLVQKMGERILIEIIPILEVGLQSDHADTREGVCAGMTEIISAAGKNHLLDFIMHCTPLVKAALVDSVADVREAAAQTFDVLYQHLGNKVIDDILPSLLADLKTGNSEFALEALKEMMSVRSNVIFPVLIPTLIGAPITKFNAQALGSLISVAGSAALNRRLGVILPALMRGLLQDDSAIPDIRDTLRVLMHSIEGDDGIHTVFTLLIDNLRNGKDSATMQSCGEAFTLLFEGSRAVFDIYIPDVMQLLIGCLAGCDGPGVLVACWEALDALVKRIKKDDMERLVHIVRKGIRDAELCLSVGEDIPGFNLPKGILPVLSILLQGLMYGSGDSREQSALGLGEIISRTSETSLKPFVTQITGPLIRVIGDRFPPNVKSAILQTMATLLHRVPAMLKPFLPQLQRTFVKSLSDPSSGSSAMRSRAAKCLTLLIPLQARLDPLVVELVQGLKYVSGDAAATLGGLSVGVGKSATANPTTMRLAIWEALYGLIRSVAINSREMSPASQNTIKALLVEGLDPAASTAAGGHIPERDNSERIGAAKCLGAFCRMLDADASRVFIRTYLTGVDTAAPLHIRHAVLLSLFHIYEDAPEVLQDDFDLRVAASQLISRSLVDDKLEITDAAVYVAQKLVLELDLVQSPAGTLLVETLIQVSLPGLRSTETRREAIVALKGLAKISSKALSPFMAKLVPALMTNVRDRTIPIKLAAERCLVHTFELKSGKSTTVLQTYLQTLDGPSARSIGDYARRVLVKIGERDSDEEEDAMFD